MATKDKLVSLNGLKAAVDKIKNLLSGKQDKLTAGTGISISNNTISSTDYYLQFSNDSEPTEIVEERRYSGNVKIVLKAWNSATDNTLYILQGKNAYSISYNNDYKVGTSYIYNIPQGSALWADIVNKKLVIGVYNNFVENKDYVLIARNYYGYITAGLILDWRASNNAKQIANLSSSKQNTITKNTQLEVNSINVESNIYFKGESATIGTKVEKIVIGGEAQNQSIFIGSDASVDVGNSAQIIGGRDVTIGQCADYLKIGEVAFHAQVGKDALNVEIGENSQNVEIGKDAFNVGIGVNAWQVDIGNVITMFNSSYSGQLYLGNGNTSVYINKKSIEDWCSGGGSDVKIGTTYNYTYAADKTVYAANSMGTALAIGTMTASDGRRGAYIKTAFGTALEISYDWGYNTFSASTEGESKVRIKGSGDGNLYVYLPSIGTIRLNGTIEY